MKNLKNFGPLFIILAALLWSFDGVLRRSLYSLPPSIIVYYEHAVGLIILLLVLPKWWPDIKKMTRKEFLAISLVALFSGALGTIFYTQALGKINYIQYSVVVLLQQLQPIWAIGAAAILLKEKITKRFLFWALVALISAYFITFKDLTPNLSTGGGTAVAGLLALGAGFLWGSSTAISKYVLNKTSFLTATALRFTLAPIFALGFIKYLGQTGSLYKITNEVWITLILIALTTGMVALAIYYYGLKKTPARVTTICELVWPASAIFIDYFYYHQSLNATQILGVIILLIALYNVAWKTSTLKSK
jgi:drug/metabolite transporter (DMT)-like permease